MIVWNENEEFRNYVVIVNNDGDSHQVMLQVRFAELKKSALNELGIDFLHQGWGIGGETVQFGSFAGQVSSPNIPLLISETVDLFVAIPTEDISAIIKALEQKNLLTTLANPNLTAVDGAEASFLAGGEFPIPIVRGSVGEQTVTIEFKEFGIKLGFIPTVLDSSMINIKVSLEVSSLDFENGIVLSGFRIPALMSRKTQTTVEINDGRHFVIGGLLSKETTKTVSGVPLLWRIPILGRFFSSERSIENDTELIVLITPHMVRQMKLSEVENE
jgi:pilus assembly protein CpaC